MYHLKAPCPYFLTLVTYGCYLPINGEFYESLAIENPEPTINDNGEEEYVTNEFGTDLDKILYCGAYLCENWLPQEEFIWVKNENYWDAEHVYITRVSGKYNAQAGSIAPEMFLRGEIDSCNVTTNILDDWLNGANAQYVHLSLMEAGVQYMLFNFNPHYDDEAAGENYKLAVNNKNFRLSIVYGLNKAYCVSAYDPYNAEELVINTMIPADFTFADGKDYTSFGDLPELSKGFYDPDKAVAFRDAAKEELTAAGATFPIKLVMTYKTNDSDWANQVQLQKSQLESVLGTDYIDVILYAGPADNFLSQTRRAGKYSMQRCNWGADYADPETWTDPFAVNIDSETGLYQGNSYNKMDKMYDTDYAETKAFLDAYYAKVAEAKAETGDIEKRYNLFAEAEAMLIENAIIIPFRKSTTDYQVTKLDVYEGEYAPFGICNLKYKFMHLQDDFVTAEQNEQSYKAWVETMEQK